MDTGALARIGLTLVLAGCGPVTESGQESPMTQALTVTGAAFSEGGTIPGRHTCDGADVSPPLAWSGAPEGTAAYALIVDDPDARGWIHWLAADLEVTELAEGGALGIEGRNDFGRTGWGGPCPPSGTHRYVFTVHALSEPLGLAPGFSADELRSALEGRVLATGSLTATYRRGG
jgi:Raf kinase inhibitor-like YbhB/YbcL family protein